MLLLDKNELAKWKIYLTDIPEAQSAFQEMLDGPFITSKIYQEWYNKFKKDYTSNKLAYSIPDSWPEKNLKYLNERVKHYIYELKKKHKGMFPSGCHIIYQVVTGSQSFGLATPTSDVDIKGVYVQENWMHGMFDEDYLPVVVVNKDETYFELKHYLKLLLKGDALALEMLFSQDKHVIYESDRFSKLKEIKETFITKQLYYTFINYAMGQFRKASNYNKMANWEDERIRRKYPAEFTMYYDPKTDTTKKFNEYLLEKSIPEDEITLTKMDGFPNTFKAYHYKTRGWYTDNSNELRTGPIPLEIKDDILGLVTFNHSEYSKHCKEYKQYQDWLEKRNNARYNTNKEHAQHYDCYVDDETLYLTEKGWKRYGDITNEKIGSIDEHGQLVFNDYIDRFFGVYSGKIYTYESRYTSFSVTENHNLFIRWLNRGGVNKNSVKIPDLNVSEFNFLKVSDYFNGARSYGSFLYTPYSVNEKEYPLSDFNIKLLGAYISDGNIQGKNIRIDQVKGKGLYEFLESSGYNTKSTYISTSTGSECNVYIYNNNTELLDFISNYVGYGSLNLKLSNEFFKFSKRQFLLLLEYMLLGDGYKHKKGHSIYYTSSKSLADDLQKVLFNFGLTSQVYSNLTKCGFEKRFEKKSWKYQVFIPKINHQYGTVSKNYNWDIKDVVNINISCFTTKHGNIVTKRKDKISIQGNSKNVMHTVRLILTATEIPLTKTIVVDRTAERGYLLSIKNGEVDLKEILDKWIAKGEEQEKVFAESDLPEFPNKELVKQYLKSVRLGYTKNLKYE